MPLFCHTYYNTLGKDHSSVPKYGQMDRTDTFTVFFKNNYWQSQPSDDHVYILKWTVGGVSLCQFQDRPSVP